ncbi:VOC family protein [Microvirga sp. BSC39]|uniref:VOC family protein n=1 Tax=Microvirga sp. BSC39 TaxID=1549810 RepID=UPI000A5C6C81|nr:VOC family protein [Microvirga sp. BSC39]
MLRLDHVQLAIPEGAEDRCRWFYAGLLGIEEVPKPPALAKRGGLWLESGSVRIHLGVEEDFRPAGKAHPAIAVADLDALARLLSKAGHEPAWDDAIPEVRRFYVQDPVGNRIEFMQG